jgi:hypothetical protein
MNFSLSQGSIYRILPCPPPPLEEISANVIWGKKYEKVRKKGGKCKRKRIKGKEKGKRGKKMRKGEVKG